MARITVEDCLQNCENRFALVHVTAKRARELYKGIEAVIRCKNREIVTALREIAAGKIFLTGDIMESSASQISARKVRKS